MASPTASSARFSDNRKIWDSLKQAIANSSGFQRWQLERLTDDAVQALTQEQQVQRYLRETLETLAY
jgi:hypothetical protein